MPNSLFSLAGRSALVTGASSGLGRRFAQCLARYGARVTLTARRIELLEHVAQEIRDLGGEAVAARLDVIDPATVPAAFDAAEAAHGPVTILVNSAGVPSQAPFLETDDTLWREVMQVNLDGAFRVAREAARRMRQNGAGGAIVNVASVLGIGVLSQVSAYAVSKAGLIQLTRAMALELARDGIRVNAIAPGYFETDMNRDFLTSEAGARLLARIPQRRAGEHAELDGPLLLLVSDAGSYMTGSVVTVDGGALLAMG
ncbi:MAG: glucose 1-dehydrogenase [Rhizobiales bacterium]|nr:glucose 1-dehydrogenase [Hyphomicrobiales bacterium]